MDGWRCSRVGSVRHAGVRSWHKRFQRKNGGNAALVGDIGSCGSHCSVSNRAPAAAADAEVKTEKITETAPSEEKEVLKQPEQPVTEAPKKKSGIHSDLPIYLL